MESNVTSSAMSASLLARSVYCVCFTDRDSTDTLQGELACAREKFFTGKGRTVRVGKRQIIRGFDGKLQGKLSRRSFFWRKAARQVGGSSCLMLEEAFDQTGGYLLVTRDFRNVIASRVFFNKALLWLKSEYYEPWDSHNARVIFKPVESDDCIERFDWDTVHKRYRSTMLYPVPYQMGSAGQSLQNARFGEPKLLVSTMEGMFCYCPRQEAQERKKALEESKDGTLVLMQGWQVKEGTIAREEEKSPRPEPKVTFTSLEEYAQIEPAATEETTPQAEEPSQEEHPTPAEEATPQTEEPTQEEQPIPAEETSPQAEEPSQEEQPIPAEEAAPQAEEPSQEEQPTPVEEATPQTEEPTQEEQPTPAEEAAPQAEEPTQEEQPTPAEETSPQAEEPFQEEQPIPAEETAPQAEEPTQEEQPTPAEESAPQAEEPAQEEQASPAEEAASYWKDPEDPEDRAILREARETAALENGSAVLGEGASYQGGLREGKPWGRGRVEQPGGLTSYEGEFEEGRRHGFGVSYYKDGNLCYAGSWKEDKRDGLGVSFRGSDHALHISKWDAGVPGEFVSLFDKEGNLRYGGRIEKGKKQGPGVSYNTADGTVFVGKWLNGQPTGVGSAFDQEGNLVYYGGWKNGLRDGHGTEFDKNGAIVFDGEWKDGQYYNGILYQKREAQGLPKGEDDPKK